MNSLGGSGNGPTGNGPTTAAQEEPDDNNDPDATDEPAPFSGRPSPGGKVAPTSDKRFGQDAAPPRAGSYFASFPANRRVTFGYGD